MEVERTLTPPPETEQGRPPTPPTMGMRDRTRQSAPGSPSNEVYGHFTNNDYYEKMERNLDSIKDDIAYYKENMRKYKRFFIENPDIKPYIVTIDKYISEICGTDIDRKSPSAMQLDFGDGGVSVGGVSIGGKSKKKRKTRKRKSKKRKTRKRQSNKRKPKY